GPDPDDGAALHVAGPCRPHRHAVDLDGNLCPARVLQGRSALDAALLPGDGAGRAVEGTDWPGPTADGDPRPPVPRTEMARRRVLSTQDAVRSTAYALLGRPAGA